MLSSLVNLEREYEIDILLSAAKNRFGQAEIRKGSFQVACNTDMKERNVATDGHSPNVMIMFSRLDDLPYYLTYGATLQALR